MSQYKAVAGKITEVGFFFLYLVFFLWHVLNGSGKSSCLQGCLPPLHLSPSRPWSHSRSSSWFALNNVLCYPDRTQINVPKDCLASLLWCRARKQFPTPTKHSKLLKECKQGLGCTGQLSPTSHFWERFCFFPTRLPIIRICGFGLLVSVGVLKDKTFYFL